MKERPILFSAPMVKALLAGTKTQTRRVVKPRHDWHVDEVPDRRNTWRNWPVFEPYVYAVPETVEVPCPFGAPGDHLWVRETWAPCEAAIRRGHFQYAADGAVGHGWWTNGGDHGWGRSGHTVGISDGHLEGVWVGKPSRWRPSIHMPRKVSRLTLEVTGVRVERLQDISNADAIREGVTRTDDGGWLDYTGRGPWDQPKNSFLSLWASINGEGSWAENPFVWCIDFKRGAA